MISKDLENIEDSIAVFDTGIGGLSLISAIHDHMPAQDLTYFTDNGRFPYGDQTAETATEWLLQIGSLLAERGVNKLVLGCNTVTAMTEAGLKNRVSPLEIKGPINDTVSVIIENLRGQFPLIFATEATLRTGAYQRGLKAGGFEPVPMPGKGLERTIEREQIDSDAVKMAIMDAVENTVEHLKAKNLDPKQDKFSAILCCTHFVLAEQILRQVLSEKGLQWGVFNPLPLIAGRLVNSSIHATTPVQDSSAQPSIGQSEKNSKGKLHLIHTAPFNEQWWSTCNRFVPKNLRDDVTREYINWNTY